MKRILFLGASIVTLANGPALAETIAVTIDNLRNDVGLVNAAVYNGAEGFPEDREPVSGVRVPISRGTAKAVFPDLKPGTYAIVFFHDENGNGKIDKNLLGFPTEGFGFSNDATGSFGPPDFRDASFVLDGPDVTQTLTTNY